MGILVRTMPIPWHASCFLKRFSDCGSAQALPFGTICVILVIWALVTFPLTVIGGIAGKNSKTEFCATTRTTKYPREVPPLPWYRQTLAQMGMAGFLPFSAIYIELYYIFSSIWGHKVGTGGCNCTVVCNSFSASWKDTDCSLGMQHNRHCWAIVSGTVVS